MLRAHLVGLALGLFVALAAGCHEAGPTTVVLEVAGPFPADSLHAFIKSEVGGVRLVETADGEPQVVAVPPGHDLSRVPFRLALEVGRRAGTETLIVHLAAMDGATPTATADATVSLHSAVVSVAVRLHPWLAPCDRDGDTFSDCSIAGCCDHLDTAMRAMVADCLDDAPAVLAAREAGSCTDEVGREREVARRAHPFRPASFDAAPDRCGDCIDQDCQGGDAPCPGSSDPGPNLPAEGEGEGQGEGEGEGQGEGEGEGPVDAPDHCSDGNVRMCYPLPAPSCQGHWVCEQERCRYECRGPFDGRCHPRDCGGREHCVGDRHWKQCVDCARVRYDCGYWKGSFRERALATCNYDGECVCLPDAQGCTPSP